MTGGTGERKAQLRERLARGREEFLGAVAALDAADLARPVGAESAWTAKDLIGHVAYAEASMLPMIEGPLAGQPFKVRPDFDLDRWNESRVRRASEQAVPDLLARLEESRRQTLARLDAMDDADLDRPTSHPRAPETTVEGIYRIIAGHERDHAAELRAVRASGGLRTQD
ncbi:MAG TPA: DinB family protein [Thermomicrobiales bacterium]|nr:DinB family protein [Thermomicrobiales bacterium]